MKAILTKNNNYIAYRLYIKLYKSINTNNSDDWEQQETE